MQHVRSAIRASLPCVVTIEPLAKTAVTEGMTTLGGVGFVHGLDAYSTYHRISNVVKVVLENVGEGKLAGARVSRHSRRRGSSLLRAR